MMSQESSSATAAHQLEVAIPNEPLRWIHDNTNRYLSVRSKGEVLADIGYCILPLSILIGAASLNVHSIVLGHTGAFLILLFAVVIQWRLLIAQKRLIIAFSIYAFSIASLYLFFHFPNGKYTFLSLGNMILLYFLFNKRKLPQVSPIIFYIFLILVYLKIITMGQGVDFVALHSKNYLFIFLLFFSLSAAIECRTVGRGLPFGAIAITAFVGFNTLGMANIVTAFLLLGLGTLAAKGKTRLAFLLLSGLTILTITHFHDLRDMSVRWHLSGQLISNSEMSRLRTDSGELTSSQRALEYNLSNLYRTFSKPLEDERISIWKNYV
ncbi:MAG: hypothetical protein ACE37E_10500 [Hyphomicrobiales bacterium]